MAKRDSVMHKPKDAKGTFRRMIAFLGPYRYMILLVFLLCLLSNVLSLLGPSLAGSAINEAAAGKGKVNFERVRYYALRMLVCYVASSLLTIGIHTIMVRISKHVAQKMRQSVFDKLMVLPVGYFDRHQSGDIISRISYDIDVISTCMATDVVSILTSIVTVVGSLVMMISISLPLSAVALITVPASILYTTKMRKITQPRFAKRSKNYGIMNGFVVDMFEFEFVSFPVFNELELETTHETHEKTFGGCHGSLNGICDRPYVGICS